MRLEQIICQFDVPEGEYSVSPCGNGHINRTYRADPVPADGRKSYLLQQLNTYVFPQADKVVENIARVTACLREKIAAAGGDPDRETMNMVPAKNGSFYLRDEDGNVWRVYHFIEDTVSLDLPDTPELFAMTGEAFGGFQRQLADFPADSLFESIPHFHDTPARFAQLMKAVEENRSGRLDTVTEELAFCREREKDASVLTDALNAGEIPLRVTHNDTKLNNLLLDAKTGRGVCVIDLDTVMPGLAAYDYGDSIRFGASTALEDEKDLSKVDVSMEMVQAFTDGYLKGTRGMLTDREKELLPWGAKLMTLECGFRFLADYLNGDVYFHTAYPEHNLVRARTQFRLVRRMEERWEEMEEAIRNAEAPAARCSVE